MFRTGRGAERRVLPEHNILGPRGDHILWVRPDGTTVDHVLGCHRCFGLILECNIRDIDACKCYDARDS
jgi:hypothetical protein